MKLSKESKIRVLENFYAIDYVLFGKPASKNAACCPALVEEYVAVKGALLSVVIEMYGLVKHKPQKIQEKVNSKSLRKMAKESAQVARDMCMKLVSSSKGRAELKDALREAVTSEENVDIENLVQQKIREKAFSLAVDNLLVAKTISEASDYKQLNEWEGRIIEDAYKILRDNLISSAILILDNAE